VTCYWISQDFESKNILLSIAELPYPHEAFQILEYIKNLLQIWNLELKIIFFITDNRANIKKAIKDLGIRIQIFCDNKKRQQLRKAQLYLQQQTS
ncbi:9924_t:CDS:2, partial [Cetraspora pellucida]